MKKIFILGLFALLSMQACKKDQELIDGKRPEERVAEDLEKYRSELINSPNGWVAYLGTTLVGGGYNFYMSFDKDNKVIMRADYNSDIALESVQSTYRVKQVMAPSIIFDTYSLLHLLQDPDPNFFEGDLAVGYGSDFEFEIREQVGDTIKLIGKKRKAPLVLVKATADQKAFYTSDVFSDNIDEITNYLADNPFTYVLDPKDNSKKVQVSIKPNVRARTFSFISTNGADAVINSGTFSFSSTGLRLNSPIKNGDDAYTSVTWDKTVNKLFLISTKGAKVEVFVSNTALFPLELLLGPVFSAVTVPNATTYPGWSANFASRRAAAANAILTGQYGLRLDLMQFLFNTKANTMTLSAAVYQGANGFIAEYSYNYVKTAGNIFKFNYVSSNGNGGLIVTGMAPLLAQRINVDRFKLDYFVNPNNGEILGQFTSIEHPDFTFSGALQ
ncbi:DUF4302 domain-containing protein [Pedobacter africanus]|uniref:Uncharacterized protein n=1 Tax=Pedobacter africanus TaxID=151894 RepID=A0ACC6KXH2_9SPHI|nr:DUF4302 domain-containing protein [Pedobacter africanus]MDR6783890.1 hypothetical protein [Pedobacter africanus]